ncbi:MAG TPA: endonuclease/exonuclease/phosphatase family protein [Gemmatimonadales bacterium]|nr:endonuclease/exonuclease/phosphatase family protein [Gemmatimonadales bacterium]
MSRGGERKISRIFRPGRLLRSPAHPLIRTSAHLLACASLLSCARGINFTDIAGPRFEGRHAAPAPRATPAEIRVVTLNVKFGKQVDRAIELLRDSDSLRGADVIALQEVDDSGTARIAQALGLDYVYFPAVLHAVTRRFFGPAILSRWPIDSAWKIVLPHLDALRRQQRTATGALIRVGDRPIRVYSVHLEVQARISDMEREDQVDAVVRDAATAAEPVIIAGDLNSYGVGAYLKRRGFRWLTESFGETIALWGWDHLFVRGFGGHCVRSVGVERDGRGASDHRALWAVLAVRKRSSAHLPVSFLRSLRLKNATSGSP